MLRAACFVTLTYLTTALGPLVAMAADECPGVCPMGQVCVEGRCVSQPEGSPVPDGGAAPVMTPTGTTPTVTTSPGITTTATGTPSIPIQTQTSVPVSTLGVVPVTSVPIVDVDPWENLYSVTVDPLGFLLYGPSLKFEVGKVITAYARIRFANLGLSNGISDAFENTSFSWGISAGGGIRGYMGHESQQGFLIGAGFEIAHMVRTDSATNQFGTTSFAPGAEIGYRIVAASGFTFTISGGAFYVVRMSSDFDTPPDNRVLPMMQLDLGYTF